VKVVMGLVKFLLFGSGWGGQLWFGFGKFPPKISKFAVFSTLGQKNIIRLGQTLVRDYYLLWLGSCRFRLKVTPFNNK